MQTKVKKIKITIRIEDNEKYLEIPVKQATITGSADLVYMLDDIYDTIKLNNMEKHVTNLFGHIAKMMDFIYEGKCYTIKDEKMVESKHKLWFCRTRPRWKRK